ncbi:MAG: translation elongation factor Ts [Candidatus Zixiibacteriota bacterium]|nr:MAG: translation elongation factor Ts [candidate division Zixibacteria bacterium]
MEITSQKVKELREKTGAGMMDCKNALVEAGGEEEKAIEILRKRGLSRVEKRAGREAKEGLVDAVIVDGGRKGVLVEVNSETDFVARTDEFHNLVVAVRNQVADGSAVATVEELLSRPLIDNPAQTLNDQVTATGSKLGENVVVRRFCMLNIEPGKHGLVEKYIHTGSKLGVIVAIETGAEAANREEVHTLGRDVAMQIAAGSPMVPVAVNREDVSAEMVDREKDIYRAQIEAEGKQRPPEVVEKIITGKLAKFFGEATLLEQPSVKYPDRTIADLVKETAAKVGSEVAIYRFCRFKIGE